MTNRAGREIELKLHFAPEDFARLRSASVLAAAGAAPARPQRQVTSYFDTADLRLAERGFALRVRRIGRRHVQSVKARPRAAPGESSGSAVRAEWEWPLGEKSTPDLELVGETDAGRALDPRNLPDLAPIFVTDVERTKIPLDSGAIELVIDRGSVVAGTARAPISEVELELRGDAARPAQLYDLALALHETVPLRMGTLSKADIGYALVAGTSGASRKAAPIRFAPETSTAVAFGRIVRGCIGHLLDNQACVLAGGDNDAAVGGIHQMRVALRRLRAALSLFGKQLDRNSTLPLKHELRWLAGELSAARDWDVFLGETLRRQRGIGETARHRLAEKGGALRALAHQRAITAVEGPRYTALVLRFGGWIEDERWRSDDAEAEKPIGQHADELLARCARRVRKSGRHIADQSIEQRHGLRKALKRLRYAASFLEHLYPGQATERYLHGLSGMQDLLGRLNDLAVARSLTAQLAETSDTELCEAAATADSAFAHGLEKQLAKLPNAWRAFKRTPEFWS